jgi:hypothetical protein
MSCGAVAGEVCAREAVASHGVLGAEQLHTAYAPLSCRPLLLHPPPHLEVQAHHLLCGDEVGVEHSAGAEHVQLALRAWQGRDRGGGGWGGRAAAHARLAAAGGLVSRCARALPHSPMPQPVLLRHSTRVMPLHAQHATSRHHRVTSPA